jgi:hypothetical protein
MYHQRYFCKGTFQNGVIPPNQLIEGCEGELLNNYIGMFQL